MNSQELHWRELRVRQMVQSNAGGTYTPRCAACGYQGKPQPNLTRALQAVRGHLTAEGHRRTAVGREAQP